LTLKLRSVSFSQYERVAVAESGSLLNPMSSNCAALYPHFSGKFQVVFRRFSTFFNTFQLKKSLSLSSKLADVLHCHCQCGRYIHQMPRVALGRR
jgi:hypothetical protein